jgi:hypothetical protein
MKNLIKFIKTDSMKKRFLPFSFFLSLIVLLFALNGSSLFDSMKDGLVSNKKEIVKSSIVARNYLQTLRSNQLTGMINPQWVASAYEQTDRLQSTRSANSIDWNVIGPDNYGGRTRALLFDNKDASGNTIFAGAVTGGIWRSSDVGLTWEKVNADNQNLFVSCLTQGSDGTIYAGTGEMFSSNNYSQLGQLGYSDGFMGSGIYKSTDGNSFTLISSTKPQGDLPSLDWAFVNEIQVDGNGRIYAATNTGLKYSDDQGGSWKVATDTDGNELSGIAYDVKAAGSFAIVTVDNSCYTTTGDATKFVNHSTGEADQLPTSDMVSRAEFAIAPSDNNVVYASLVDSDGFLKGIYRSKDSGVTWSVVLPETQSLTIFFKRGVYNNVITVFPDDANRVLLGGLDLWVGYQTGDDGLFFWEQKSNSFSFPYSSEHVAMGHNSYSFRPGHANQFVIGTNSGIYKGEINSGEYSFVSANRKYYSTQFYRLANSGIENYCLSGAQENGILILKDESNSKGYANQIYSNGSNGGDIAVSLINPDVIVYGSVGGRVFRSEDQGENISNQFLSGAIINPDAFITPIALWESFDNENSRDSIWYYAREDIAAGSTITVRSNNSGYPFKYKLEGTDLVKGDSIQVVDPVSSRLFIAVKGNVFMTKELHDFTVTPEWFTIANSTVGFEGIPSAVSYSSDCNHLWVGTLQGKVYRISNLALAYNKALADVDQPTCIVANSGFEITNPETGNPMDQAVTSISVDPSNPSKVVVTYGNYGNSSYVFYTENALDQSPAFDSKQGNLPEMPVYSSVIEMSDSKRVIIGTEFGVFSTDNISSNSPTWTSDGEKFGKVPVFDLRQQTVAQKSVTLTIINGIDTAHFVYPGATNYGIIYAGTYGRGLFKTSTYRKPVGIDEILSEGNAANRSSLKVYPNPAGSVINFKLDTKTSSTVEAVIYNQSGMQVKSEMVHLNIGSNKVSIDVSGLATGSYIIKVKNGLEIRTQKFVKL